MRAEPADSASYRFDVLYQDNHLLVVHKPAGLATMGAMAGRPSLHQCVTRYLKHKFNKPGNVYLGIVSRLDAQTAGVVVLAKTSKAAARLTRQFAQREVDKSYLAIVESFNMPPEGRLLDHLVKNDQRKRMEVCEASNPRAKRSELTYRVLGRTGQETLLQLRPRTGRKHQIRVQLAHRQAPILGDRKYGSTRSFDDGIALLAHALRLEHPVRKTRMSFITTIPNSWKIGRFGLNLTKLVPWPDGNRLS